MKMVYVVMGVTMCAHHGGKGDVKVLATVTVSTYVNVKMKKECVFMYILA